MEDKNLGKAVGQAALIPDTIGGKPCYEIGYILKKEYWGKGHALRGYAKKSFPENETI